MVDSAVCPGQHPGLTPCHWGSVNQWECDENDHLNVRFYAHKINQAIQLLAAAAGDRAPAEVLPRIRAQHIRFLRESRVATPLRVDCGVVHRDAGDVVVLSLMHHNVSGEVLASFLTTLDDPGWAATATAATGIEVPEFAQPRGIVLAELPAPPASLAAALQAGYRVVGRGVIDQQECDQTGVLLPHVYIGRISDGMPNLWAFVNGDAERVAREQGNLGGAALEQRLAVLEPLRAGAVFTQLSGVRALGSKTQNMSHLLFDESRGRFTATAEAVSVAMDLETRKAVPISAERRSRLQPLLLQPRG